MTFDKVSWGEIQVKIWLIQKHFLYLWLNDCDGYDIYLIGSFMNITILTVLAHYSANHYTKETDWWCLKKSTSFLSIFRPLNMQAVDIFLNLAILLDSISIFCHWLHCGVSCVLNSSHFSRNWWQLPLGWNGRRPKRQWGKTRQKEHQTKNR